MAVANRLYTYVAILAFQGLVLFGAALIELTELSLLNLIVILFETVIFKAIVIPAFLNYIIKKNNITREAEPYLSNFISVIVVTCIIVVSFLLSNTIHDEQLKGIFFVVALSASHSVSVRYVSA
jgi:hydrogenase-4 component E